MSLRMSTLVLDVIQKMMGRRLMWRLGRLVYRHARRDGHNDPEINGEYALHQKVSQWASRQDGAFNVVDVGANIGYWSSHLLDVCRSEGVKDVRLWAFEPSDEIRKILTSRMEAAPSGYSVTISAEAVSDEPGHAAFDASPGITGIKHLLTDSALADGETPSVDVAVTTLADVFKEQGIDVAHFVKSDIEGFDLSALRGAAPLLAEGRIGLFQFEYNHCWVSTRSFLHDVFDLVKDYPYQVCKVVPNGIDAYDAWHIELETFFETNYLLVRNDLLDVFEVHRGHFGSDNTYST